MIIFLGWLMLHLVVSSVAKVKPRRRLGCSNSVVVQTQDVHSLNCQLIMAYNKQKTVIEIIVLVTL